MHAASPPNPNHAIRFQPCSTQSLQRDDNREHNAQISSSSSSRRRRCHQPCSRHAYAPSFAGRTASAPLCTQRLPLPTPLDPSFERLAPPPLSAGCAQSKMSSCECGLFNLACGPPPRPGPTTFGVLCYQNEYCDWCTSLRVHFPNCMNPEAFIPTTNGRSNLGGSLVHIPYCNTRNMVNTYIY